MSSYLFPMNKGFIVLLPALVVCFAVISAAYLIIFEVYQLEYAYLRRELYAQEKAERTNCMRLESLYVSFDPLYLRKC